MFSKVFVLVLGLFFVFELCSTSSSGPKNLQYLTKHEEMDAFTTHPSQEVDEDFDQVLKDFHQVKNRDAVNIQDWDVLSDEEMKKKLAVFEQIEKEAEKPPPPFPKLDISINMGVECPYEYRTLTRRVSGVKVCKGGEHCCGCRSNKCCRAGQLLPKDDPNEKIFGTCEDTFWSNVRWSIIVVFLVCSLIGWIRKRSARTETTSTSTSLSSEPSTGDKKKFSVLICKKKEDNQKLIDNGNAA